MKILLLIDGLAFGGGAERQFVGLAQNLHARGYDLKVVAYHDRDGYQAELVNSGINVEIVQGCDSQWDKIRKVRRIITDTKPEIVISYKDGPNRIACVLKALGAKWKLIVSDRNTLQKLTRSTNIQYRILYRMADRIVPNSFAQGKLISDRFPKLKNKTKVITNFTDTSLFKPANITIKPSGIQTILIVARIAAQKNVLNFLEAARILSAEWANKVRIVWYGRPNVNEGDYAIKCYERIKEYRLEEFFSFENPVRDIENIYRKHDIFCLPSNWEGFPNVLCEAMSSGMIVCASRICDNEKIVEDDQNGFLFNPCDPNEIASTLDRALRLNESERNRFKHNARLFAESNLDMNAFTEKYISVIESISE